MSLIEYIMKLFHDMVNQILTQMHCPVLKSDRFDN